jgi:hypothetical protein
MNVEQKWCIERAELRAEIDRLRDGLLAWQTASMDIGQQLKKAEAEVERLRADAETWKNEAMLMGAHQGIDNHQRLLDRADKAEAEVERLRADAEPVAWRFRLPSGKQWHFTEHRPHEYTKRGLHFEPLYANPAALKEPK